MEDRFLNLTIADHAYMLGFVQADGHLEEAGGKGRLSVEVAARDAAILEAFADLVPYPSTITCRTRDTNFKRGHRTVIWRVCDRRARVAFKAAGLPSGRKAALIAPPPGPFSAADYFRGLVDANGSLGLTGQGLPFLSLCTASRALAEGYVAFLAGVTGRAKTTSRNRRDGLFNITLLREPAQAVIALLYYEGCLCLPRKLAAARKAGQWQRPGSARRAVKLLRPVRPFGRKVAGRGTASRRVAGPRPKLCR